MISLLAGSLSLVGCSLAYCDDAFLRERGLRTGEIAGTALLPGAERKPAAFVQAAVRGTSLVRRTASDGRFLFSGLEAGPWLVTVSEDADGDGKAERRRVISAVLRYSPHRTSPSYVPLVASEGEEQLSGVDVGEVLLEGTARVAGRVLVDGPSGAVPPSALGRVAVVVAGRNLELPRLDSDGSDPVSLGAEAKTGADDTGAFLLRNVSAGRFYLMVLIYDEGTSPGAPGALLQVSAPVELQAVDGEQLALDRDIVLDDDTTGPPVAPVQLVFSPSPTSGEQVYLAFVPPGLEMPPCEDSPVDYTGTPFAYALTSQQVNAGPTVSFNDAPVGVWDIQSCFTRSPAGKLFTQTVTPEDPEAPPVLLGPVLLTTQQECRTQRPCGAAQDCSAGFTCDETAGVCVPPDGWSDCDGDETRGLPRIVGDDERAIWSSCVSQCFTGPGTAVGDKTCDASDGNLYDCDDDGDGQADVTEQQACYGVGRGTDSDGDGLCDGIDPWPECRANTAAACEAGKEPDVPAVPQEYASSGSQGICEAETYTPASPSYCDVRATEVCSVDVMACTFTAFTFEEQPANYNYCNADGEGCPVGFACQLSAYDEARGFAPCFTETEPECPAGCPTGFFCQQLDDDGSSIWACLADMTPDLALDPLQGELSCYCCDDPNNCPPDGAPSFTEAEHTTPGVIARCEHEEAMGLWRRCDPLTTGGGENSGDGDAGLVVDSPCITVAPLQENTTFTVEPGATCLTTTTGEPLVIRDSPQEVIDLGDIETIQVPVVIEANTLLLTQIEALSLTTIRGGLRIEDNFNATGSGLAEIRAPLLGEIQGDLIIVRNPYLIPPDIDPVVGGTKTISVFACIATQCPVVDEVPYTCATLSYPEDVCVECVDDFGCQEGVTICDDDSLGGTFTCVASTAAPTLCGNGVVDADSAETCDDGNQLSGDGCNRDCAVEPDFTCPPGGGTCTPSSGPVDAGPAPDSGPGN